MQHPTRFAIFSIWRSDLVRSKNCCRHLKAGGRVIAATFLPNMLLTAIWRLGARSQAISVILQVKDLANYLMLLRKLADLQVETSAIESAVGTLG